MVNKIEPVIGLIIISLLISFGLVFGSTYINNPTELGNYSSAINFSCNASNWMAHSNMSSYNLTVYYNASGGPAINSTSFIVIVNSSAAQIVFENSTANTSALADGKSYNFTCYFNNVSVQEAKESINITIDNTAPNVSAFVGSNSTTANATNNNNYTNNANANILAVNVSVSDTTVGMLFGVVDFNFSFSNGTQRNFTRAINIGNVSFYYAINISNFPDGTYYIYAHANDTLGNMNRTKYITVKLDKTAPVVTFVTGALGNYSGSGIKLNISSVDATIGTGDVYFNISNKTKNQYNFT